LQRTVKRHHVRAASAPLHYALAVSLLIAATYQAAAADSFPLKGPWFVAGDVGSALTAAAAKVTELGYAPDEFRATVSCNEDACEMEVYPYELETDERYRSVRGCPLKYCATLTFSKTSRSIVNEEGWR
jgi:hypothetical protein